MCRIEQALFGKCPMLQLASPPRQVAVSQAPLTVAWGLAAAGQPEQIPLAQSSGSLSGRNIFSCLCVATSTKESLIQPEDLCRRCCC